MSIATIALNNKSSPPRRGVVCEDSYGQALERTFRELGSSVAEKQREELQLIERAIDDERRAREAAARRREAEVMNARVVARQMELRRERDLSSRMEESMPAVSSGYSGYPNFPETPDHERRLQKLAKQQELKRHLDEQYHSRLSNRRADEELALLAEKQRLEQARRDQETIDFERAQKRVRDREALTKAWEEAERAKAIRTRIERMHLHGLDPRREPLSALLRRLDDTPLREANLPLQDTPPPEKAVKPVDSPEEKAEEPAEKVEEPTPEPPQAVNRSVVLPKAALEKGAHSRSFDAKEQAVALPVIQQYRPTDVSHKNRARGRLAGSLGRQVAVAQVRSRKASQEPIQVRPPPPPESPKANWTFATTNPTTDRAISHQSASGRSHSQVVKPSVYIVRKYEHQRYYSRVLAETGANTLQRNVAN